MADRKTLNKLQFIDIDAEFRQVALSDLLAIEGLHDRTFGPGRFARTAYKIREGLPAISALCHVAELKGRIVAAVRMAPILIGGRPGAQLLGPLAVEPELKGLGIGRSLCERVILAARTIGCPLIVLVGDLPYYQRFGFFIVPRQQIELSGPVDPDRLLCLELVPGALNGFRGLVTADLASSIGGGNAGGPDAMNKS
jgi:predicted N-acetyltransferase YhbS